MDASQVIALTSIAAGALVGIGGLVSSHLTARQALRHAEALAKSARRQDRLESAYLDVLEVAESVGVWARSVKPVVDTLPAALLPELPAIDLQVKATIKVNAFGSPEVRALVEEWRASVNQIRRAAAMIDFAQDQARQNPHLPAEVDRSFMDYMTPWRLLEKELRPAEAAARTALTELISEELGES